MNLTNFQKLQYTLATFAFTKHFDMETFCSILPPSAVENTPCGTTLCLSGFGAAHYLGEQHHEFFAPTPEHLASHKLHDSLVEKHWKHDFHANYYITLACNWLDILPYQASEMWYYQEWPESIKLIYRQFPESIEDIYLSTISDPNRISKLSQYQLPLSYFRALAGAIALQAFIDFHKDDVHIETWVDHAEEFEEIHSDLCDPIAFWIHKYSDLVARFETIGLNSEAAKQYVLN
jgi:hypothetical protein